MFFFYILHQDNETELLELRPASEILDHMKQKRFQNVGRSITILDVKRGLVSGTFAF